jgi:hypothetical protein
VPTTNVEIDLDCPAPNQWRDRDTGQDATNLVSQLNEFNDFQPKITTQQIVKLKATITTP